MDIIKTAIHASLPDHWQSLVHLRRTGAVDWWRLCQVECACFGWERMLFGLWPKVFDHKATVWIVEIGSLLAGYVIAYPRLLDGSNVMYVGGIGTLPTLRRYGLATRLMQQVLAGTAWLHVRAGNEPAIRLYERLNMRVLHRLPRFYTNGEDALVFVTPDLFAGAS